MQFIFRSLVAVSMAFMISACGGHKDDDVDVGPKLSAIGVNGYLWQATLDTLSFMPFDVVEPNGGIIVTDWHSAPATPNERVKVTVNFRSTQLRSDGIKVNVLRQKKTDNGWQAVPVQAATELQIEEAILMTARRMRVSAEAVKE